MKEMSRIFRILLMLLVEPQFGSFTLNLVESGESVTSSSMLMHLNEVFRQR